MSTALNLTEEQAAIVAHDVGPALVFAVAGAGKTTAMVHRIERLVRERVFPANNGRGCVQSCKPRSSLNVTVHVMRRMLSAISSRSNTFFQSSRISRGLPKVMALLQASENCPGISLKITADKMVMWPSRKSRADPA